LLRRVLLLLIALGVVVCAAGMGTIYFVARQPLGVQAPQFFYVQKGEGLSSVSLRLSELSGCPYVLVRLIAGGKGISDQVQSGEYQFAPYDDLASIFSKLVAGDRYLRRITIAEGLSNQEVLAHIKGAFGLNLDGLKADNLPRLPETYTYEWGDSAADLYARMADDFDNQLERLWGERAGGLSIRSKEEAVILASIIEKETGVGGERAKISAVFHNRLRLNMRLQSDPTVIFALTGGPPLGRPLSKKDLRTDSPHNTYRVRGLPPSPIANPGTASLEAALNPADVPYLYFVATGTGGHNFAETLEEHNKNVRAYRRKLRSSSK